MTALPTGLRPQQSICAEALRIYPRELLVGLLPPVLLPQSFEFVLVKPIPLLIGEREAFLLLLDTTTGIRLRLIIYLSSSATFC